MTNKERLEANNAKIEEITKTLARKQVSPTDMLQAKVDATNSMDYLFYKYPNDNIDYISKLDTSKVISMEEAFSSSKITSIPPLDISSVKNMLKAFYNSKITSIPPLDMRNVDNMERAFGSCSLTEARIAVDNVKNLDYVLSYSNTITKIELLNTGNVQRFYAAFGACTNLKEISPLDLSSAIDVSSMFDRCEKLTKIELFNTSNIPTFNGVFYGCKNLKEISTLDMLSCSNISAYAFSGCSALENIILKNIKVSLSMNSCSKLTDESLINTFKELWDLTGSTSQTLTLSTTSKENIANIYVKLVEVTDEMRAEDQYIDNKKPCVVCESTDEGAMTLTEYLISKNWSLA